MWRYRGRRKRWVQGLLRSRPWRSASFTVCGAVAADGRLRQFLGKRADEVGPRDDADQLAVTKHRDPLDALAVHQVRHVARQGILGDCHGCRRHDGFHFATLLADAVHECRREVKALGQHVQPARLLLTVALVPAHQVAFAEHTDDCAGIVHHRDAADPTSCHQLDGLQQGRLRVYHRHIAGHQIARRDHRLIQHDHSSFLRRRLWAPTTDGIGFESILAYNRIRDD